MGVRFFPYLHVFNGLDQVHHQMEVQALEEYMLVIGYHAIRTLEHGLPNRKSWCRLILKSKEGL